MAADRYRALFESMADPAFVLDEEGRILEVNEATALLYGYARDEMVGLGIADYSAEPEESARGLPENEVHAHHRLHKRKDGTVFPVEIRANSFSFEGRKTFVGVARDITERVRAEAVLRESEARYRAVLATAMDGFWRVDGDGRLLEANATYCRMSGYAEHELLTMRISDLEVVETPEVIAARMRRIKEHGDERFTSRHRRKDGSVFDVEVSAQVTRDADGHGVVFLRDTTEQKRLEAAVAEQERLTSMGLLTASLGHELNNPLAYVLYNVDALGQELSRLPELAKRCAAQRMSGEAGERRCEILESSALVAACESVGDALGGLHRINEITQRLRALSKVEAPRSSASPGPLPVVPAPSDALPRVRGRLLVVDDEEPIRRMLARLLGRDHEVVIASSGAEARALLEVDRAFDVVLSDLMMPDLSGMDLHAWLLTVDPGLARNVVFMSGGAFIPKAADYLARVENRRVEKPFVAAELKQLVAELVHAARSEPSQRA